MDIDFHCGNSCPLEDREAQLAGGINLPDECPQEHWCQCCGDCLYCYGEPCYDDCGYTHGYMKRLDH